MFGFKPLGHPPLVVNASFCIQNKIPRKSIKTINASCSCSQGKTHGKHIAARMPKHMRSAYEIDDFMESCFLVFRGPFYSKIVLYSGLCPNQMQKCAPRECNESECKFVLNIHKSGKCSPMTNMCLKHICFVLRFARFDTYWFDSGRVAACCQKDVRLPAASWLSR